jgi:hypothetical protein
MPVCRRSARPWLCTISIPLTEVLTEFLAFYSAANLLLRTRAVSFVRATLQPPHATLIPQTRPGFLDDLTLYEERPDMDFPSGAMGVAS